MRYVWLAGAILFLAMLYTPTMGEEPCSCSDAVGQWDTTRVLMENGQPNAIEQLNPIREKMEIKEAGFCKLTGSFGNGGTITGTFLANSLQSGTDTNFGGEWSLGGKSGDANLKFYCEPGKGVTKFSGDMVLKEENTRTEWRWEGTRAGSVQCEDKSNQNLVLVSSNPCQWICKDGYGFDENKNCVKCADVCKSRNKNEVPDTAGSVGGQCACTCNTDNGEYYNNQGVCTCENGEGRSDEGKCIPCYDVCQSGNKNEFPYPEKCVAGKCYCGPSESDLKGSMSKFIKGKNPEAVALFLTPFLKSENPVVQSMALIGIQECYERIKDPDYLTKTLLEKLPTTEDKFGFCTKMEDAFFNGDLSKATDTVEDFKKQQELLEKERKSLEAAKDALKAASG